MKDKYYAWPRYQARIVQTNLHLEEVTRPSVLQPRSVSMLEANQTRPWLGTLLRLGGRMQRLLVHPPNLVQAMLEPSMMII